MQLGAAEQSVVEAAGLLGYLHGQAVLLGHEGGHAAREAFSPGQQRRGPAQAAPRYQVVLRELRQHGHHGAGLQAGLQQQGQRGVDVIESALVGGEADHRQPVAGQAAQFAAGPGAQQPAQHEDAHRADQQNLVPGGVEPLGQRAEEEGLRRQGRARLQQRLHDGRDHLERDQQEQGAGEHEDEDRVDQQALDLAAELDADLEAVGVDLQEVVYLAALFAGAQQRYEDRREDALRGEGLVQKLAAVGQLGGAADKPAVAGGSRQRVEGVAQREAAADRGDERAAEIQEGVVGHHTQFILTN